MKKGLIIFGSLVLLLFIFRGVIFRLVINYDEIGSRPEIEITNKKLIELIESSSANKEIDLGEILEIANRITKEELKFTTKHASYNPNELIYTNQANCVGYSAMYNSVANYLISKNKLEHEIEANHKIGQLSLFGINIHKYFNSPFFKDHDFNEITKLKTGEKIFIDPSVSDVLWIREVSSR